MIVDPHPSNSREQQHAEQLMMATLSADLGLTLSPAKVRTPDGCAVAVDGLMDSPHVLCESFAHIGALKAGQVRKVNADALKLLYLASFHEIRPRLILLFCDPDAARSTLSGRGWQGAAFRRMQIEVRVVSLPQETTETLLAAQRRQFR